LEENMIPQTHFSGLPIAAMTAVLVLLAQGGLRADAASQPSMEVKSASGSPGDVVTIGLVLRSGGNAIASSSSEIALDREVFVAAAGNGPDCTVNSAVDAALSDSRYRPQGCNPDLNCTGTRTVILTPKVVADGTEIYTCRARIAADAAIGEHPVRLVAAEVSDLSGNDAYEVGLVHGAIHVVAAAPGEIERESRPSTSGGGCRLGADSADAAAALAPLLVLAILVFGRLCLAPARSRRRPRI
jgi:hypothetical protein